jgi:hypothetical protein
MRSFLSLLPALALICSSVVGCAGVDSIDGDDAGVDQAALRIDGERAPISAASKVQAPSNPAAADAKVAAYTATPTRVDTNQPTDDGDEPRAGSTKGDDGAGGGDTTTLAPPVISGVALALRQDGSLTMSVMTTDTNDGPLKTVYTGFTRGVNQGTTVFLLADDLAAAAIAGDGNLEFTVEDAAGESAKTSIWLDLDAIVQGSLGDSITPQS